MRVARVEHESAGIKSLVLEPADGVSLAVPLPGQFVVLRLRPRADAPPLLRSYSLSGAPSAERYRVTVKREPNGPGSGYLLGQVGHGSVLDVSAPRGTFTLRAGDGPVVLLSAGVGATPVMAMLHALAAEGSRREIWWLYGARDRADHPFAAESRSLAPSRTATSSSGTADLVRATGRAWTSTPPGTGPPPPWTRWRCLPTRTSTCADRPASFAI
jgi:ferredoxin-NADP reductase